MDGEVCSLFLIRGPPLCDQIRFNTSLKNEDTYIGHISLGMQSVTIFPYFIGAYCNMRV
jgi:hypothetical protein